MVIWCVLTLLGCSRTVLGEDGFLVDRSPSSATPDPVAVSDPPTHIPVCRHPATPLVDPIVVDAAAIRTVVAAAMPTTPGMAVAVVSGGQVVFAEGFGTTQVGGTPVDEHTVFNSGSVSKMFTGLAAADLTTRGLIDLQAPVVSYASEFVMQGGSAGVTVAHTLAHTSGINDYTSATSAWGNTLTEEFALNPNEALHAPPGEVYVYTNRGYQLAGLAIERAAGQPFDDVLEDRIFTTLGFPDGGVDRIRLQAQDHAVGVSNGLTVTPHYLWPNLTPQTGVWLSAADGGVLLNALLGHHPDLDVATWSTWTTPQTVTRSSAGRSYGFGLEHDARDIPVMGHGGSFPGFSATLNVYPTLDLGIAVFGNADDADVWGVLDALEEDLVGLNPTTATQTAPSILGTWTEDHYLGDLTISGSENTPVVATSTGSFTLDRGTDQGTYYGTHPDPEVGWQAFTVWPGVNGGPDRLASRAGVAARQ